jgi:hypothetical protein
MRRLLLLGLLFGCAPANYLYSFDLTDPGAKNFADFRRPDALEDADVRVEIRADPTEFKAIALEVTNKTEMPLTVADQASIILPDHSQTPLRQQPPIGQSEAGAHVSMQLVPFQLPSQGDAAKAYDNGDFELVLPLVVRGQPRENRYHLHAKLQKI